MLVHYSPPLQAHVLSSSLLSERPATTQGMSGLPKGPVSQLCEVQMWHAGCIATFIASVVGFAEPRLCRNTAQPAKH
jgi:hypothetical protein